MLLFRATITRLSILAMDVTFGAGKYLTETKLTREGVNVSNRCLESHCGLGCGGEKQG